MIKTENKILRNLQEQVLYNSNVLEDFLKGDKTISEFGIHVVAIANTVDDLPTDYNGNVGDAILIGTEPPYRYYVWTNINNEREWVNIGQFPEPGPQGERGEQGPEGPVGQSSRWYYGAHTPDSNLGNTYDMFLRTDDYTVYTKTEIGWVPLVNIKGSTGVQGPRGIQGPQGIQGIQGPRGPKGDSGVGYQIEGIVNSTDNLPDPVLGEAYLVGTEAPYQIFLPIQINGELAYKLIGTTDLNLESINTLNSQMDAVENKLKDISVWSEGQVVVDTEVVVDKLRSKGPRFGANGDLIGGSLWLAGNQGGPLAQLGLYNKTTEEMLGYVSIQPEVGIKLATASNHDITIQQGTGHSYSSINLHDGVITLDGKTRFLRPVDLPAYSRIEGRGDLATKPELDAVASDILEEAAKLGNVAIGTGSVKGRGGCESWLEFLKQFPMIADQKFTDRDLFANTKITPWLSAGQDAKFKLNGGVIIRNTSRNVSMVVISTTQDMNRANVSLSPIYGTSPFDGHLYFENCRVRRTCQIESSTADNFADYGTVYIVCVGYSPVDLGCYLSTEHDPAIKVFTKPYVSVDSSISVDGSMASIGSTFTPIQAGIVGQFNELQKVTTE